MGEIFIQVKVVFQDVCMLVSNESAFFSQKLASRIGEDEKVNRKTEERETAKRPREYRNS